MAHDLIFGVTSRNFSKVFVGQDVRDVPSSEQKIQIRQLCISACLSVGLGVVSGLVTHNILKYRGER